MVREVLEHYGIEYEEVPHSNEIQYYCPFHIHSDNKLGSSRFDEDSEIYNCFACSEGGNLYKFVMLLEGCDFTTARQLIETNFNINNVYDVQNLQNNLQRKFTAITRGPKKQHQQMLCKILKAVANSSNSLELLSTIYPTLVLIAAEHFSVTVLLEIYSNILQLINLHQKESYEEFT